MKVKDPVCGMIVEDKDAKAKSTYERETYHFCSTTCKEKFEKDPAECAGEKAFGKGDCCCSSKSAPHEH